MELKDRCQYQSIRLDNVCSLSPLSVSKCQGGMQRMALLGSRQGLPLQLYRTYMSLHLLANTSQVCKECMLWQDWNLRQLCLHGKRHTQ